MSAQLLNAAENGDVERVGQLIASGANPNVTDFFSMTPLHHASAGAHLAVVEYLIGEAHVDVDTPTTTGLTALHFACRNPLSSAVMRYLIDIGGADIEQQDRDGYTALHQAVLVVAPDTVRFLVEQRQANVNMKNKRGRTPLEEAIRYGSDHDEKRDYEAIIRCLLPRTASVSDKALQYFFWYYHNLVDIRRIVLEKYALGRGVADAFRNYPIQTLLKEFPFESVQLFRDSIKLFPSSALSLQDEEGRLPLHVALTLRDSSTVMGVVDLLFELQPKLALARDPTTGLYPHETAAYFVLSSDLISKMFWFDMVYRMFRSNPQRLLQSRVDLIVESRSTDDEYDVMGLTYSKENKDGA